MEKLLTLTGIAGIGAVLALLAACQTTGTGDVVAQKESLLSQSGFKVITVTTPKQQQQAVSQLAQGRVSAVKYNGKLYYVYPTAQKDKIYVGRQRQYNAYKQALQGQQAQQTAAHPVFVTETAGPQHIEVDQFQGFGPMGVQSLGNW
jgi:crotonobetainyl-CoA:carnitine CoA-transferase CaiB-like acyl-CoA transferase